MYNSHIHEPRQFKQKIARTNYQSTKEVYMTPLTARAKFVMTRNLFFRACPLCRSWESKKDQIPTKGVPSDDYTSNF